MASVDFANLNLSLRAPRLAVAIHSDHWEFHAQKAIEVLSRVWGGAGGVIVPIDNGEIHPAVRRLLEDYNPDYVAPMPIRLHDAERLDPGSVSLTDGGVKVASADVAAFIGRAEAHGPRMLEPTCDSDVVDELNRELGCFWDRDSRRIYSLHPDIEPPRPLVPVQASKDQQFVAYSTGNASLDLAIGAKIGLAPHLSQVATVDEPRFGSVATKFLSESYRTGPEHPFGLTVEGLSRVSSGSRRRESLIVVLGQSSNDLALAMLWDRTVGGGVWLPVTRSHEDWLGALGVDLDVARLSSGEPLLVTSTSLSESQCRQLMDAIWAARYVKELVEDEPDDPWHYVDPADLDSGNYRIGLAVDNRFDERVSVPVTTESDGTAEMIAPSPLVVPDSNFRGWIVDVQRTNHPTHLHRRLTRRDLIAHRQNQHETFIRPSRSAISFESGRWDFVASGASRFGQLAQPRLKWLGLLASLNRAVEKPEIQVQRSHAGQISEITANLFGGHECLAAEISQAERQLIDAFVAPNGGNGPLKDSDPPRLRINNRILVSFQALAAFRGAERSDDSVRDWLDLRAQTGLVRSGFVLSCSVCPWIDFYRLEQVGQIFQCNRCGADSHVIYQRWRKPRDGPNLYYEMHPAAIEYFRTNGDVPTLAAKYYQDNSPGPCDTAFELEFVDQSEDKRLTEVDFTVLTRDRLVVGEAKLKGKLDGNNACEHKRDAMKLFRAAASIGADEVCFASAEVWGRGAVSAMDAAAAEVAYPMTVAILENVRNSQTRKRTELPRRTGS